MKFSIQYIFPFLLILVIFFFFYHIYFINRKKTVYEFLDTTNNCDVSNLTNSILQINNTINNLTQRITLLETSNQQLITNVTNIQNQINSFSKSVTSPPSPPSSPST
jgi:hypothetical protein